MGFNSGFKGLKYWYPGKLCLWHANPKSEEGY